MIRRLAVGRSLGNPSARAAFVDELAALAGRRLRPLHVGVLQNPAPSTASSQSLHWFVAGLAFCSSLPNLVRIRKGTGIKFNINSAKWRNFSSRNLEPG